MPKPVVAGQRYLPGLDGLRAVAVLAVIAFHEQFGWAQGGLLGVGIFFTLSGYLITGLLLSQWSAHGALQLRDFWLRRARRLLPALFVMLAVVTAWVTLLDRARLSGLRGAVAAAATYSSNWYLIAANQSYFARFAPPAPFDHLWSLAVEEQFYLLWPLLLAAGLFLLRGRRLRGTARARWLALPTLALAAVSALVMLWLYQPGFDPTRVYEGTDTRAFGLLIGAALAMIWPAERLIRPARRARLALDGAGLAGLAVIGWMIWRVGQYSPFAYRGGLVLLSVATAAVVAVAACPGTLTGAALGWRPLRWIGVRSYGIYLWHYPVIVLTTPANAGPDLPRAAAQIAACLVLAALSWHFIEEPVRHGALTRLIRRARARASQLRAQGWPASAAGWRIRPAGAGAGPAAAIAAPAGAATALAAVLVIAGGGLAGAFGGQSPGPVAAAASAGAALAPSSVSISTSRPAKASGNSLAAGPGSSVKVRNGPLRTSCHSVVHIGDSTSDGLVSADYLPNPRQRITARYHQVGVTVVYTNIVGARSVAETLPGTVNGYDAALGYDHAGYHGCWVIALGTDDTADVAVGSNVTLATRIRRMMAAARGEPVMWVNVKSLVASGPYAEANMRKWNDALLAACASYPNMRIFNWAALAQPRWFIPDGIHYTSAGYEHRAKLIADALARAFPLTGQSGGCVVS